MGPGRAHMPRDAEHFRADHHPCPHPDCLERKFVVFAAEAELKRHFASEHGGDMSRAQRRQALTVPIQLQVDLGEETGGRPWGEV
jgi:hypothetical protein